MHGYRFLAAGFVLALCSLTHTPYTAGSIDPVVCGSIIHIYTIAVE